MADKTIKTKIVLDGEKEFKAGLTESARALKVTESEMKAAASAYGVTGDRASYLADRQKLLKQALAQQEGTVNALKGRVDEYANALGSANAGTQNWTIRLNNAQTKANVYRAELQKVEKEMTELGRDSVQAGRKLEQGIGEGAAEAADDVQTLLDSLKSDLSTIQFGSLTTGIKSVWDMASGAYSAIDGFVSGTVDYRRQLSFLEENVKAYGVDFADVKSLMFEVSALTGDTNGAMETVSTLLATAGVDDLDKLHVLWEGIAGATIKYQGIMTSQGMAEAIQETLATGSAVGQLAEYLEREGVDVEEFNKALEESKTDAGDLNIILSYLAAGGLNDVYTRWADANDEFVKAQTSAAEWEDEQARAASALETLVIVPVREEGTLLLRKVNDEVDKLIAKYEALRDDETGATQPGIGVKVSGFVDPAVDDPTNYTKVLTGKREELIQDIPELEAEEKGKEDGEAYANGFEKGATKKAWRIEDELLANKQIQAGWEFDEAGNLRNKHTDLTPEQYYGYTALHGNLPEEDGKTDGEAYAEAYGEGFAEGIAETDWAAEAYTQDQIQAALDAIKTGTGSDEEPIFTWTPAGGTETPIELDKYFDFSAAEDGGVAEGLDDWKTMLEEAGEEGGEAAIDGYEIGVAGAGDAAYKTGQDMATQMAAGMLSKVTYIGNAGQQLASAGKGGAISGAGGSGGAVINVGLNVDGREFAKATATYIGQEMART